MFDNKTRVLERKKKNPAKNAKIFGERAKSVFTETRNLGIIRRFEFSRRKVETAAATQDERRERDFSVKIVLTY